MNAHMVPISCWCEMRMQGFHTCTDPAGYGFNQRLRLSIFYPPGIILLVHICKRLLTPMKQLVNYLTYTCNKNSDQMTFFLHYLKPEF